MIVIKGDKKPTDGLYEHRLPENKVASGIMHAYQKDGKWVYMSEEDYKQNSQSLPDVCIAFKCQIPNMDTLLNGPKPLITADLTALTGGDEQVSSTLSNKKV
jgi:hypothetical protein